MTGLRGFRKWIVLLLPAVVVVLLRTFGQGPPVELAQNARQRHSTAGSATFNLEILRILEERCQVCHRDGGIAPMPFETYEQTRPYAAAIKLATQNKSMPPWFADPRIGRFSNDPSLTPAQIAAFTSWADAGAPAGEVPEPWPPPHWAGSWSIRRPDLILKMPKGVALPANGDVEYTYEIVRTGFKGDRWVQAVEILPSLRANVHHAVVYVRPPESPWMRHAPVGVPFTSSTLTDPDDRRGAHWTDSDVLLVYAPGSSPDNWPEGLAKLIPAGSDLVFQMHYTTNGHAGSDQSCVGLIFAKDAPGSRVLTLQLTNDHFVIPPGAPDYRVEARGTLPNDATLLSFFPHMHLRGKRFEYNIIHREQNPGARPDQEVEPLLDVHYHFHWQMSYQLLEPRFLKAGTELQAVAWYDNSRDNPHNPDPEAAVRWGEQTYDEMMVWFFLTWLWQRISTSEATSCGTELASSLESSRAI